MRTVLAFVFAIVVGAMPLSSALADWGCGYRFSNLAEGRYGSVWGEPSQAVAQKAALDLCRSGSHQGCYIVKCLVDIDNKNQAQAVWPLNGAMGYCFGTDCK